MHYWRTDCAAQHNLPHMPVENASSRPTGGLRAAPLSCQQRFSDKIGVEPLRIYYTVDGKKQSTASEEWKVDRKALLFV